LEIAALKQVWALAKPPFPIKPEGASRTSKSYLVEKLSETPRLKVEDALDALGYGTEYQEEVLDMREVLAEVKEMVHKAITESEELDEFRLQLQKANDLMSQAVVDEKMDKVLKTVKSEMKRLQKEHERARPRVIEVRKDGKKKQVKGTVPEEFEKLVQLASQRINTLLVGPAGCGKTTVAGMVAETLDLKFSSISCSAGMSESMLQGWLLPVGDHGRFEHVAAPFIQAYEKGGVFLLDELDAADPNVLVFLNTAIAGDHFFLPQRLEKPMVKKHKDFVLLAAANTFGNGADMQYVGRNQLDAATMDRFRTGLVKMDYSPTVEDKIVHPDVLDWGLRIRKGIARHNLRRIMSTRTMVNFSKMTEAYNWKEAEWNEQYFADWTQDERNRIGV
jgi:hypothetical protein